MDKITNDTRIYTDIQGLSELRTQYKSDPDAAKKEVSKQFEALFIQMVLRSMRQANETFSSGLLSSSDMSLYQDMFDKQLALSLSQQGIGLAKMIEDNINHNPLPSTSSAAPVNNIKKESIVKPAETMNTPKKTKNESFSSPAEFIQKLAGYAKHAANLIGVHPSVLLAQAALETDWGKKVIAHAGGDSSYNLFNIKADAGWHKNKASAATLEQQNGILVKEKASFKSYDSWHESFMDYAKLITKNPRYQKALAHAHEPKAYVQALKEAGYATDSNYCNKIMNIMNSQAFKTLLAHNNFFKF